MIGQAWRRIFFGPTAKDEIRPEGAASTDPWPTQESDLEIYSPTWRYVSAWCAEEITALAEKLESPRLDERATAFVRGQIAALRIVAEMPETISRRKRLKDEASR